jgi:Fe-S-cluster containining protein
VGKLAKHLRITPGRVLAEFTVESADEGAVLRRTAGGCIFLSGNECTVYDARPRSCVNFPHVVRGNGSIVSRMWEMVDRAVYCPIVYNTLEAFKDAAGFRR